MNFDWIENVREVIKYIPGEWRFVGGCVRDSLLGIKTYDIDIVALCKPDVIEAALFDKFTLNLIGKKFGTVGVYYKGWSIEITTARKDIENFGRYAEVEFNNVSFYEDSARRDFTINSLMMSSGLQLYDYHDGILDLRNNFVRFVGDARERIQEDYLRIMRYIRFFIRFSDGDYDKDSLLPHIPGMLNLSKERIIKEMESMCKNKNAARGFEIMNELGISLLFFKGNLRVNIDDNLKQERKIAYALYDINLSSWPINRNIRRIHDLRVCDNLDDNYIYMAYIWHKHKDISICHEMNFLLSYLKRDTIIIDEKIDLSLGSKFEGKNRGMAELLMRYYHLIGHKFDYDEINANKEIFYTKIKNL